MIQGRPLLATAADAKLFVGRDTELGQLGRSVRHRFNVAIVGERGSGKSSLLHHFAYRERESRRFVYVDATDVDDVVDLVRIIEQAAFAQLEPGGDTGSPSMNARADAPLTSGPTGALPFGSPSAVVPGALRRLGEFFPMVVLLDATYAGKPAYQLFGRLRNELWNLDHRWIVAMDDDDWADLDRPPADAFFDIVVELEPFEQATVLRILERREAELPSSALEEIAANSDGNPRRALELVRQALIEERPVADVLAGRGARERAARSIGRPHSMLLAVLEDADQALSPSDDRLQAAMGWTSARLGQVLRDLEERDIVTSTQERQSRGRPRKLYRPNERFSA
jgi:energy-coupling factor transporter ATP-binding protein EcfA2